MRVKVEGQNGYFVIVMVAIVCEENKASNLENN